MEMWEIANRTRGAVEIGCVRTVALQPGERYVFSGPCPEPLRWLEGNRKVYLTRLKVPKATVVGTLARKADEEQPARGGKTSKPDNKPQATQV